MSPIAKMPGSLVSKVETSTGIRSSFRRSPQLATGPELHGQAEERQHGVAGDVEGRAVAALDVGRGELAVGAFEPGDLALHEVDLAGTRQRHHLVDAVGGGAEFRRRCSSVRCEAIGARLSVQSSALSPPPTIRIFLPLKASILRTA